MDPARPSVPVQPTQPHRRSRRSVLKALGAAGVSAYAVGRLGAQAADPVHVTVGATPGALIPADFTGLSYESAQLSHPGFFNRDAATLARFFGLLGSGGVLRIGGNLSEFTFWNDERGPGPEPDGVDGPDPGHGTDKRWTVNPAGVDGLAGFLDLTGWKLIYGLNLAGNDLPNETKQAEYVWQVAGKKLLAMQFGNEPDLFKHNGNPSDHWSYDEYHARWKAFYDAIHPKLPQMPLAGPDTSFQPTWMKRFCEEERSRVALLTGHYYAGGPPSSPQLTTRFLLEANDRLQTHVLSAIEIARANGLPFRMCEGNTCYSAGKQGVSDTFAAALWAADFWLQLAAQGATGVNLHGGGNGLYTPIAGSPQTGFTARPVFYGMLLAGHFADGRLLPVTVDAGGRNVVAYAAQKPAGVHLVVLNRTAGPVTLRVAVPTHESAGKAWRLEAPSLDSTSGVTLAGAEVTSEGRWQPRTEDAVRLKGGAGELTLAPFSAALVRA